MCISHTKDPVQGGSLWCQSGPDQAMIRGTSPFRFPERGGDVIIAWFRGYQNRFIPTPSASSTQWPHVDSGVPSSCNSSFASTSQAHATLPLSQVDLHTPTVPLCYDRSTQLRPVFDGAFTPHEQNINLDEHERSLCGALNDNLQNQLKSHLNRTELNRLRREHGLSSSLRKKTDIYDALKSHRCVPSCVQSSKPPPSMLGKRIRGEPDDTEWPVIIDADERENIINTFIQRTSDECLSFVECSFCGTQSARLSMKEFASDTLDTTLLEEKVCYLRERYGISEIEPYRKTSDNFWVCRGCMECVRRKKFIRLPLYSYANGCWVGPVPSELEGLTFLEEMCIARVRSTRCTVKLSSGKYSQYASRGNVCVFPQEPKHLMSVLPPPVNALYDEIAVIFVNNKDTKVTEDMLRKSPLLVRKNKISDALKWLKSNNRLYKDIVISGDNLSQYSDDGFLKDYPVQSIVNNDSEGTGYVNDSCNDDSAGPSMVNQTTIQSCGFLDSDNQEKSLRLRKLEMLKLLMAKKQSFVKYPTSSSEPLPSFKNNTLYALLWPSLFPYGVGSFDDEVRCMKSKGFRTVDLKRHVKHLLTLADTRFQTHVTFPFVMMNILQRRTSSFESRLMVKRTWFKDVMRTIQRIDIDDLESVREKLMSKKKLDETESEKSVAKLLNYVNYMTEDISGSIGEVRKMKSEIRSIMRVKGLPHLFVTINPADTMNPITQVFTGRDIDLNKIFHDLSNGKEEQERLRSTYENPAATARAFDTVINAFVNILLGYERHNKLGIFGPVDSYYGVVEAQGRGSLHCHFFVWLKTGLDPHEVRDKLKSNDVWREHFFRWLETIIKQDLPDDTNYDDARVNKKVPLMSRPETSQNFPNSDDFIRHFRQDLRNLLHVTGQIHEHSFTCFKHLSSAKSNSRFNDADCRFGLPRETVPFTYVDEDGHIHLVCKDGRINNYNDIIVYCLRCNMDCKYIGSGTAAYAMAEYVTNYIAKVSLDSSVVFSCLFAALTAIYKNEKTDDRERTSDEETARLLIVKISNGLVGKRELSGQQVTSFLQGIPNRYSNHRFHTFWWSSLLRYVSRDHFSTRLDDEEEEYVLVNNATLNSPFHNDGRLPDLVTDYLYRPPALSNLCLWDFWCKYQPGRRVILKQNTNDSDARDEEHMPDRFFLFADGHPKKSVKILRPRKVEITPILAGIQIPRCDKDEEDKEKFQVIVLTLFKPWDPSPSHLKPVDTSWDSAFKDLMASINYDHATIMKNFQAIFSCKDAAHDFSTKRRRLLPAATYSNGEYGSSEDVDNDLDWLTAMNSDSLDSDVDLENVLTKADNANTTDAIRCASDGGFYNVEPDTLDPSICVGSCEEGTDADIVTARRIFEATIKTDIQPKNDFAVNQNFWNSIHPRVRTGEEPFQQFMDKEANILPSRVYDSLYPHRKLCIEIIHRYTLNEEQALAFLLFADPYGLQHCVVNDPPTDYPVRLIISGPGGTGKSQIFQALRCFLHVIGHEQHLKVTAPTGLAANNIGGTTVHSEINLRISSRVMLSNDSKGQRGRDEIEKRYANTRIQIIDEIYFMSARDNALLSQYLTLANENHAGNSYGNLNMIFAGDPAQLPPPKQMPLFDRNLVQNANNNLNALNENALSSLSGVVIWHEIQNCVVLSKIMRQSDKRFQDLLNRLRFGVCNTDDYEYLQQFVLENRSDWENADSVGISLWASNPSAASPLITYTNAVRDAHNVQCSKAFALYLREEYHEYHSTDTVNRGKTTLSNFAAEAAWKMSVKKSKDLSGKLPLVPQMPIFLTQNLATHLGLSNGGSGKLVSFKYVIKNELRYAISAVVEIDQYNNGPPEHPHRLTIVPVKAKFDFALPGKKKFYSVTRWQLPIIPAFAFTAHNSQSRSLTSACIDLQSCRSTAAAYVMLSRLRSVSGLTILRNFEFNKISRHSPEETRNEIRRLNDLHTQTVARSRESLKWYYDAVSAVNGEHGAC